MPPTTKDHLDARVPSQGAGRWRALCQALQTTLLGLSGCLPHSRAPLGAKAGELTSTSARGGRGSVLPGSPGTLTAAT